METAPSYRGQFDKIWLWKDWPDRWGGLSGIDLVARTRTGELWAIQAKAYRSDRPINKPEIDKFLSDSARAKFAHRLLMGTTDHIGRTARETINGQDKKVTLFLRGHFLTAEVQWPVQIGGTGVRLPPHPVQPHQATAIEAVVNGFRAQDRDQGRGRLIMACGTGKTLTALWIAERLQSCLTLVLVPSLSLVQQNLAEWGRHAAKDFDTLVVCSDETVGQKNEDEMIQSAADLAVKPTTDPEEIRRFLSQRRMRSAVVFATYQSSDRIAAAQVGKTKPFDLAICDEAHRLAGNTDALFKTVLDPKKIKARKRLFMTAKPKRGPSERRWSASLLGAEPILLGAGLPTPPKRPTAGLLFKRCKTAKRKVETFGPSDVRGRETRAQRRVSAPTLGRWPRRSAWPRRCGNTICGSSSRSTHRW